MGVWVGLSRNEIKGGVAYAARDMCKCILDAIFFFGRGDMGVYE